jgi:hypothetical protein
MDKSVDYELQDASVLINRIEANKAVLAEKGFPDDKLAVLTAAYDEAKGKNTAQEKAVKFMNDKTIEQNRIFSALLRLIVKIQKAAKSAYGEDLKAKKKYKMGEIQPRSVNALINWGEYFTGLLLEEDAVLLRNGLVPQDITEFHQLLTSLHAVDPSQESAKKLQVTATKARDNSIKRLKDQVNRTRNFVKAAFSNDEEMLIQFQPVPKGRAGAGNGDKKLQSIPVVQQ